MEAMHSQQHSDPHDVALIARVEEELSSLKQSTAQRPLDMPVPAFGPQLPPVEAAGAQAPRLDTTFRPAALGEGPGDARASSDPKSPGERPARSFTGLLVAACIGVTATIAWQSYGDAAIGLIAARAPQPIAALVLQLLPNASPPAATAAASEPSSPAAAQPAMAEAAPAQPAPTAAQAQPAPPAQAAPENAAPATVALPPEVTRLLQSMAQDLATARQQIAELKAGQDQMARDVARVAEQDARRRVSAAPPPRPAAAPARRPVAMLPPPLPAVQPPRYEPRAVAAPPPPIATIQPQPAPPQIPPPPAAAQPPGEPQLAAVPRPPMPVQ